MDPELKAYLDALRDEIKATEQRAVARDAETRTLLGAQIEATEQRAAARDAETRQQMEAKIDEVRRQARADNEAIIHEIKALPEAFSTFQRAEADRLDAAREEQMLNHHVLPLEAGAASHEGRLNDHEKRIKAVEKL